MSAPRPPAERWYLDGRSDAYSAGPGAGPAQLARLADTARTFSRDRWRHRHRRAYWCGYARAMRDRLDGLGASPRVRREGPAPIRGAYWHHLEAEAHERQAERARDAGLSRSALHHEREARRHRYLSQELARQRRRPL